MNDLDISNDTIKKIKTNQSLVHIKHSITISQYKYWHLLLKFFNEQLDQGVLPDKDGFYSESISKIKDFVGYEISTKQLRADIEALRKEPIVLNYLEKDGKPAIHGMGFVSEYKITSSRISFKFPSFIEKVIKGEEDSKMLFLLLNWNIFNSFTGKYEAIIYKLCRDYLGVGRTPYFTLEEYREYIGLKESEYTLVNNLTRRCIKIPSENINKSPLSDIFVEVELNTHGRKVLGVYFKIKHKKQNSLPFEEFQPSQAFEFAKISIPFDQQAKYLEKHSEDEIKATIERANEYIDQLKANNKTVNMGAIYNKAFNENWGEQRLQENLLQQQEDKEKQKIEERKQEMIKAQEQEQLSKEESEKNLLDQFNELPVITQTEIVNTMLEKNKSFKTVYTILNKEFVKHGFEAHHKSPAFRGNLLSEIKVYLGINES